MAYTRHNFETGQVLEAADLNTMEDGIVANEAAAENAYNKAWVANETANSAKTNASQALSDAGKALTAANTANTNATDAVNNLRNTNSRVSKLETDLSTAQSMISAVAQTAEGAFPRYENETLIYGG